MNDINLKNVEVECDILVGQIIFIQNYAIKFSNSYLIFL